MTEESSDSDYHSENDKVSEFEVLKETLNNHIIEWPEIVAESKSSYTCCNVESECSSASSSCYLASIPECCEENNENDQKSLDAGEKEVNIMKESKTEEARKRLEIASKLLEEGQISLTRFLQLLDPSGEWFPEDSKFSFEVEEENVETNTIESTKACEEVFNKDYSCYQHNMETNIIESIMKDFYGPDWSSPFYFEFNAEIEA